MQEINLIQAYDLFIFDRQTFCLDKTVNNYRNTIRYFCSYISDLRGLPADDIKIGSITSTDLKNYVVWLRNRPANIDHPLKSAGGRLSNRSVRNYIVDVKTFFNFLHGEGYVDDICSNVKVIKPDKKTVIPLSANDVQLLDRCYNVSTPRGCRLYCIVHLMLDAGLRSNEVCILRLHDLNFDNHLIFIRGKGSKERIVPMTKSLFANLYDYVNVYRGSADSPYLFIGNAGDPITDNTIKSIFARLRKRCGIQRLRPHLLRHTFATCFILGGGSVEMLRILLGHESISTTQIYMHLAAVYEFVENPYELDPIFFKLYKLGKK